MTAGWEDMVAAAAPTPIAMTKATAALMMRLQTFFMAILLIEMD